MPLPLRVFPRQSGKGLHFLLRYGTISPINRSRGGKNDQQGF